jgi:predicted phage-related endonuclease
MTTNRKQFLERRKLFIGGSDVGSVLGVGDYACALRVYKDKTDAKPDFPDQDSPSAKRGREMEDFVADRYSQETKRRLTRIDSQTMPGARYLGVSADRIVHYGDGTQGPLEIKVLGIFSFKKIKEAGLYDEYILQLQHALRVLGMRKGSFAIFCPEVLAGEGWEMLHWDIEVDDKLGDVVQDRLTDFWELNVSHKIPPMPLAQPAKPCPSCPYRIQCTGLSNPLPMPRKPRKKKGDTSEPVTDNAE